MKKVFFAVAIAAALVGCSKFELDPRLVEQTKERGPAEWDSRDFTLTEQQVGDQLKAGLYTDKASMVAYRADTPDSYNEKVIAELVEETWWYGNANLRAKCVAVDQSSAMVSIRMALLMEFHDEPYNDAARSIFERYYCSKH